MPVPMNPKETAASRLALAAAVSALGMSLSVSFAVAQATTPPAVGCKITADKGHTRHVAPVTPSAGHVAGAYRPDPGRAKLGQGAPQVAGVTVRGYDPRGAKQLSAEPKCRPTGGKP